MLFVSFGSDCFVSFASKIVSFCSNRFGCIVCFELFRFIRFYWFRFALRETKHNEMLKRLNVQAMAIAQSVPKEVSRARDLQNLAKSFTKVSYVVTLSCYIHICDT